MAIQIVPLLTVNKTTISSQSIAMVKKAKSGQESKVTLLHSQECLIVKKRAVLMLR